MRVFPTVLDSTDAVVFVVETASEDVIVSGDDTFRAEFVWPQANYSAATFHWKNLQLDGVESNGLKTMPSIIMPTRMPSRMPADKFSTSPKFCATKQATRLVARISTTRTRPHSPLRSTPASSSI